jgi:hypothetical protein
VVVVVVVVVVLSVLLAAVDFYYSHPQPQPAGKMMMMMKNQALLLVLRTREHEELRPRRLSLPFFTRRLLSTKKCVDTEFFGRGGDAIQTFVSLFLSVLFCIFEGTIGTVVSCLVLLDLDDYNSRSHAILPHIYMCLGTLASSPSSFTALRYLPLRKEPGSSSAARVFRANLPPIKLPGPRRQPGILTPAGQIYL